MSDGSTGSDAYSSADFYDCMQNSERLSHETEDEAIEAYLDSWMTPGCSVVDVIRDHSPVEVRGLKRAEVDAVFIGNVAHRLLEMARDEFEEEYGDPDGDSDCGLDDDAGSVLMHGIVSLLLKYYGHGEVWHCEEVGTREYSAEEVEAKMRAFNPEWFELNPALDEEGMK